LIPPLGTARLLLFYPSFLCDVVAGLKKRQALCRFGKVMTGRVPLLIKSTAIEKRILLLEIVLFSAV